MTLGSSFRLLEHTADIGVEARAGSREKVLEEMARGLVSVIYGESPAVASVAAQIVLRGEDPVELLVSWLNEVVYWCERDGMVPAGFMVESSSDLELRAVLSGEVFDPQRHVVERSVKSVTYHQACLDRAPDGWYARVYIDL